MSNSSGIITYIIVAILYILFLSSPVSADNITLQWVPATTNVDGTLLNDCAGTRVFHSIVSGQYNAKDMVEVGCTLTEYVWQNLGTGAHYFVIAHFDYAGNQSAYSREASIMISSPGPAMPDITVSDSVSPTDDRQIHFGNITEGSLSTQTLTIINDGNADLILGTIASGNPLSDPFSIINDSCSNKTVSPSFQCTMDVRFSPSAGGPVNDTFSIPSNDPDEDTVSIYVSGTGTPLPVADISAADSVSPADDLQMPFGSVTEFLSEEQTVTITNTGNAGLDISSIAGNNPLSSPFSIRNDSCSGRTVSPSSKCTFTVHFEPVATGQFNDSFYIHSNDPDENVLMMFVSGNGLSSVTNNPPNAPSLVYPKNQQKGLGKKVGFRWIKSKDPDGDPITYDLLLCQDQNFSINCISQSAITASLMKGQVYYAGIFMFPGGLITLAIIMLAGILGRQKLIPLSIAIFIITSFLLISCGGSSEDTGWGIVTSDSSQGVTNDEITYSVSDLNTRTTYYWKVTAKDSTGAETSSVTRSFDTN